jgi:hypothetical protein
MCRWPCVAFDMAFLQNPAKSLQQFQTKKNTIVLKLSLVQAVTATMKKLSSWTTISQPQQL